MPLLRISAQLHYNSVSVSAALCSAIALDHKTCEKLITSSVPCTCGDDCELLSRDNDGGDDDGGDGDDDAAADDDVMMMM